MGGVVRFAAVNSKVRVLEGRFLEEGQIGKLLDCKSFGEAVRYLYESTPYRRVLKDYRIEELHRGRLEVILKKDYIRNFDKFQHYFNGDYKKLLKIFFMRFEIEDIKIIMRGIYIKKTRAELSSLVTYQSTLSSINYEKLIKAEDIGSALEELKGSVYYSYIENSVRDIEKEGFFRFETSLDSSYYSELISFVKKLDRDDRKVLEMVSGIQVDLINLQWILRAKKYYKLYPEEILAHTIYYGHRLSKDKLKELSYVKSVDEFFERLKGIPYRQIFLDSGNQDYLIEREIFSYLKGIYQKYKRDYRMNISVLYSFLELAYLECRDVIAILESKRYSVSYEESSKFITDFRRM
jgi:V/A-type H+-transporting ATPase subunit C